MNIVVDVIHKNHLFEKTESSSGLVWGNDEEKDNFVSCHLKNTNDDIRYFVPKQTITLLDKLFLSENMNLGNEYDCVLEIESFKIVQLYGGKE